MSIRPPLVDASGNIFVHINDDLNIELAPAEGSYYSRSIRFRIVGTDIDEGLANVPGHSEKKQIAIPAATFEGVERTSEFAVVDITDGSKVLWSGKLVRYS